jgi:hypothetical protein
MNVEGAVHDALRMHGRFSSATFSMPDGFALGVFLSIQRAPLPLRNVSAVRTSISAVLPGDATITGAQRFCLTAGQFAFTAFMIDPRELAMLTVENLFLAWVIAIPPRFSRCCGVHRSQRNDGSKCENDFWKGPHDTTLHCMQPCTASSGYNGWYEQKPIDMFISPSQELILLRTSSQGLARSGGEGRQAVWH